MDGFCRPTHSRSATSPRAAGARGLHLNLGEPAAALTSSAMTVFLLACLAMRTASAATAPAASSVILRSSSAEPELTLEAPDFLSILYMAGMPSSESFTWPYRAIGIKAPITGRRPSPRVRWLMDSHVHLSDPAYLPGPELACLEGTGTAACCVSTCEQDSRATVDLASRSPNVVPFVGVHPSSAGSGFSAVEGMAASAEGIGEVGLDPSYPVPMGRQRSVFGEMLRCAERLGLPVSIHSRGSLDEVIASLPSFSLRAVLLHWFDGSKRQLRAAMDAGFYVSFGPLLLYAGEKQALLARADRDRILVETDGPVGFSHCFGGRPARPCFAHSVALRAARKLGLSYERMCGLLRANSERYLGFDPSIRIKGPGRRAAR